MPATKDLLHTWMRRARESEFSHYAAEQRYERLHYLLGIPAAILAAIVGTAVFTSLTTSLDPRIKIAVGLTSVIAAVLSGLQTFLRYSERAERHRVTATKYSAARRKIEQVLIYPDRVTYDVVNEIRTLIDTLAGDAPNLSLRLWSRSVRRAGNRYFLSDPTELPEPQRSGMAAVAGEAGGMPIISATGAAATATARPIGGR
jgi:Protein of unknown function (DUF4231)